MSHLASLPTWAIVLVVIGAIAQFALTVLALVKLLTAPRDELTMPWWGWLIVILAIQTLGAIAFLIGGRRRPETAPPIPYPQATGPATQRAVDTLYGTRPPDGSTGHDAGGTPR